MSHEWVIVGAGGFAREVTRTIEGNDANGGTLLAVEPEYLPDPPKVGMYEVTTIRDAIARSAPWNKWFLGVGDVALRRRMVEVTERYSPTPIQWGTVRSSCACVAHDATISCGVYIGPMSVVSPKCMLGPQALVNQLCSIGHGTIIGAHAVVSPGCILSGKVTVGAGTFLGSSVTVYPGVRIGTGCKVAAGTIVKRDIPDGCMGFERHVAKTAPLGG